MRLDLNASECLQIPEDSVHVVDTPGLQDGKNETWQEEEIADLVSQVVREHHVSTVRPGG